MIIKAELYEGNAYLLDEAGNIWKIVSDIHNGIVIHKIYKALPHEVEEFMKPQLARYEGK